MTRILASVAIAALVLMAGCMQPPSAAPAPVGPSQEQALLWSSIYAHLEIRPYYVEGYEPSDLALDGLLQSAREVTGKTVVTVKPPKLLQGYAPDRDRTWTAEQLRTFHREAFGTSTHPVGEGDTAVLAALFLDGRYVDDAGSAAGVQAGHELYVFMDQYGGDLHLPLPAAERVERAVLIHEFGHALGLVNCGIPMVEDREKADSPCHSTNPDSVMSSRTDLEPTLDQLDEGEHLPYRFDANDREDLRAFREQDPGRATS